MWRVCVEGVCGGCVWRVCVWRVYVEGVCGGCVCRVCVEGVCGGCVCRVCVESVCMWRRYVCMYVCRYVNSNVVGLGWGGDMPNKANCHPSCCLENSIY